MTKFCNNSRSISYTSSQVKKVKKLYWGIIIVRGRSIFVDFVFHINSRVYIHTNLLKTMWIDLKYVLNKTSYTWNLFPMHELTRKFLSSTPRTNINPNDFSVNKYYQNFCKGQWCDKVLICTEQSIYWIKVFHFKRFLRSLSQKTKQKKPNFLLTLCCVGLFYLFYTLILDYQSLVFYDKSCQIGALSASIKSLFTPISIKTHCVKRLGDLV